MNFALEKLAPLNFGAQNLFQQLLPGNLGTAAETLEGSERSFLVALISNGLILLFALIVIAAIIYAALAGLKYIRSQGDETKVGEANEAIKSVLIGLFVAFLGAIFVVIIANVFAPGSTATNAIDCFFNLNDAETECVSPGDND